MGVGVAMSPSKLVREAHFREKVASDEEKGYSFDRWLLVLFLCRSCILAVATLYLQDLNDRV
jgi:hypothetical protein